MSLSIEESTLLLNTINSGLAGGGVTEDLHFRNALEHAKPQFLNILDVKARSAEARSQIQSCNVQTKMGTVALDRDPDVTQILLLSDELQINELDALDCVLAARRQSEDVNAASAAGVLFDQRSAWINTLVLLLQARITGAATGLSPDMHALVTQYTSDLLSHVADGKSALIQRLAAAVQSDSFDASPESQLPYIVDAYGRFADRNAAVQRERTALCQCLVYACWAQPRFLPSDTLRLLETLHHLALKVKQPPAPYSVRLQLTLTMIATMLSMLPCEGTPSAVVQSDEIQNRINSLSATDLPYGALLKVAWGTVRLASGRTGTDSEQATKNISSGLDCGALDFAAEGVLRSVFMQDEPEDLRHMVASALHQLIEMFIEHATDSLEQLAQRSAAAVPNGVEMNGVHQPEGAAPGAGTSLMVRDARGVRGTPTAPQPDTLSSLLEALAAVIEVSPSLVADDPHKTVLGEFLQLVESKQLVAQFPSVFLSFIKVMGAVASTEGGARMIFYQLREEYALSSVSWRRMFGALVEAIRRYNPPPEGEGAAKATRMQNRMAPEYHLSVDDTRGLCAYADLFAQVMVAAPAEEMTAWLRQLEGEVGLAPVWEVLFQVMCCPVPQELKAALDRAIAALARKSEIVAALWERLLAAVVVQRVSGNEVVPRYDLTYQLNEIESRSEDYMEVVAFVQLLNALWQPGALHLADGGTQVAHFTRFICEEVLGTVFQRTFRDEAQRWELVAVALEHCERCVKLLDQVPSPLLPSSSTDQGARAPGLDIMMDLANEGSVARASLTVLASGTDMLAEERHGAPFGVAKEAAVLAALCLLRTGFECGLDVAVTAQQPSHHAPHSLVDTLARHDRSRILLLLDYVRYPHNTSLQKEAVKLASHLAEHLPNLVPLLLHAAQVDNASIAHSLQDGFATCLRESLDTSHPKAGGDDDADDDGPTAAEDSCASLVLNMLLSALNQPAPNLTHLLCGYEVDGGMAPVALVGPLGHATPLTVVLDVVASAHSAAMQPRLYERCLELVYALSSSSDTGPATLDLLHSRLPQLLPLFKEVVGADPPTSAPAWATSMYQRAWLLHLVALQLQAADVGVPSHKDLVVALLKALYGGTDGGLGLRMLGMAGGAPPEEPQLAGGEGPEVQRMLAVLDVSGLLSSPAALDAGAGAGVWFASSRGEVLIDVIALKDALLVRYNKWTSENGAPGNDALKRAARAALKYAQEYNAYVEQLGAQSAALEAWQAVVSTTLAKRLDVLLEAVGSLSDTMDLLLDFTERCLQLLPVLLHQPSPALALPLCSVVQTAAADIEAQVTAASGNISNVMPHPHRCHALLDAVMRVLWESRKHYEARVQLYNTIMSYFKMCQGPAMLQLPAAALEVLMETGVPSLDQVEALQDTLEQGNLTVLGSHMRVLDLVLEDSVSSVPHLSTIALSCLAALVAADPTMTIAEDIYASGLPARLLQGMKDQMQTALTESPPVGQVMMLVAEAQLTLLVTLAVAGGPSQRQHSVQRLFSLQALTHLTSIPALDVQPEEPGFGSLSWETSFRHRLHLLLTPTLRLVLALVTGLPDSPFVRQQAAGFIEAHSRTLVRIMHDVASPGVRGWEPSEMELQQGLLAAQLLTELGGHQGLGTSAPQLQEAMLRAAARFLCGDVSSQSPVVAKVLAAKKAGRMDAQLQGMYLKVLSLRCALCAYLQQRIKQGLSLGASRYSQLTMMAAPPAMDMAPTLAALRDSLLQAALEDLPYALEARNTSLNTLQQLAPSAAARQLFGHSTASSLAASGGIASLASSMSGQEGAVAKLFFLVEMLLATIYMQLRRGGEQTASHADMDQMFRVLEPALVHLVQQASQESGHGHRQQRLQLLLRRTKECLGPE